MAMTEATQLAGATKIISSRHHVERCCFSRDGKRLAACFGDYSLRVFSIETAHAHAQRDTSPSPRPSCSSSPEESVVAEGFSVSLDYRLTGHASNVWCADFSPDGSRLCSGSSDKTARVWALDKPAYTRLCFGGHDATVWCCSFDRAGELIASGSSDDTAKIWDSSTGQLVHSLAGFRGAVESLDWSADGDALCTGSRDGLVRLWRGVREKDGVPTFVVVHATDVWIRLCRFSTNPGQTDLFVTSDSNNGVAVWSLQDLDVLQVTSVSDNGQPSSTLPTRDDRHSDLKSNSEHNVDTIDSDSHSESGISPSIAPRFTLKGHTNVVWGCSFVRRWNAERRIEEDLLVSCAGDRTLRLL